jgi:PKD repeat protein
MEVAHSYSAPGTYNVTLTLIDDGGFSYSTSRQITVSAPEEPSGGGSGGGGGGTVIPGPTPPAPSPRPSPAPAPGIAAVVGKAKVSGGVVALKLSCSGGPCSGIVRLRDHGLIGKAGFNLAAGAGKTIHVHLNSRGLALLAKKASLKVSVAGSGIRSRTVTISTGR